MPEGDAQKKEIDQANQPGENLTREQDATSGTQVADAGASTDAQKKEIQEV